MKSITNKLFEFNLEHSSGLPVKATAYTFVDKLLKIMFPHFNDRKYLSIDEVEAELLILKVDLQKILNQISGFDSEQNTLIANEFILMIPVIFDDLLLDAKAIELGDPAAENLDEVILTYPGFFAIAVYRVSNFFYKKSVPLFPRLLTEYSHRLTGIDIHPGASIGKSFCIDHGTGIVIGETTNIGDSVKIYQGVTLGALSVDKKFCDSKRHPTIGDNVVIYSNATILGGKTIIGNNSIIGGNTWLTTSVEPYSIVFNNHKVEIKKTKDFGEEPYNFII
ncbi:MAG: serine O-acetyltransferase EpsC [Candidatus Kapaibacterium sp.]